MEKNKNRVLALYNILLKYTDEEHPLSMKELREYMESSGHSCSEDSISRYIKQLRKELGVDIIAGFGRNAKYFIGSRLFEKEELKLMIDSINASNFIQKDIAEKMINKLKSTSSIHDEQELTRNVLGVNIAKTENKKILYNVNKIQEALNKGVQIEFENLQWNKNKKLVKKNVRKNRINPWALIWANDRYYLYGYDITDELKERHYRVDKLSNVELLEIPRKGENKFKSFDASTYVSRRMGMFSGDEVYITVKVPEKLVGVFIDQFGSKIVVEKEKEDSKVIVSFTAVDSNILLGWLIGLEGVEIISPKRTKEKMIELIEANMKYYKEE